MNSNSQFSSRYLFVINAYQENEINLCNSYINFRNINEEFHFLTRHLACDYAHPLFGLTDGDINPMNPDNLSSWTDWAKEEIMFDRKFYRKQGLRLPNFQKPPSDLELIQIPLRIFQIISHVSPSYIGLGHPDNWLGNLIGRIAEDLCIPNGYAYELSVMSNLFFNSYGHSNNHPNLDPRYFTDFNNEPIIPLQAINRSISRKDPRVYGPYRKLFFERCKDIAQREWDAFKLLLKRKKAGTGLWQFSNHWFPILSLLKFWSIKISGLWTRHRLRRWEQIGWDRFVNSKLPRCVVFLHAEPEAAVLFFGRKLGNQAGFIKLIRERLGADFEIYVKEHPDQNLMLRSYNYLREIKNLSSGFIPREIKLSRLVGEVDLIATLQGTIVIEAAENGIVVILGDDQSWISNLPNVLQLTNQNFTELLQGMLEKTNGKKLDGNNFNFEQILSRMLSDSVLVTAGEDIEAQVKVARSRVQRL